MRVQAQWVIAPNFRVAFRGLKVLKNGDMFGTPTSCPQGHSCTSAGRCTSIFPSEELHFFVRSWLRAQEGSSEQAQSSDPLKLPKFLRSLSTILWSPKPNIPRPNISLPFSTIHQSEKRNADCQNRINGLPCPPPFSTNARNTVRYSVFAHDYSERYSQTHG